MAICHGCVHALMEAGEINALCQKVLKGVDKLPQAPSKAVLAIDNHCINRSFLAESKVDGPAPAGALSYRLYRRQQICKRRSSRGVDNTRGVLEAGPQGPVRCGTSTHGHIAVRWVMKNATFPRIESLQPSSPPYRRLWLGACSVLTAPARTKNCPNR
jgi:hypothetical protein